MGIKTGIFEMIIKLFKSDIQQLKNNSWVVAIECFKAFHRILRIQNLDSTKHQCLILGKISIPIEIRLKNDKGVFFFFYPENEKYTI